MRGVDVNHMYTMECENHCVMERRLGLRYPHGYAEIGLRRLELRSVTCITHISTFVIN